MDAAGPFIAADGCWLQVLRPSPSGMPRPALFLDRDGTIVDEVGHLRRPHDVRLRPGAASLIAAANRLHTPVVIVTNQSGVGRGLFGWTDFAQVQQRMLDLLAACGASVDAVLACPFHARAEPPWRHPDHPARKPNPGMLQQAAQVLPIALARSWIVGDRKSDLAAGRNAGLAGGLFLMHGGPDGGTGELADVQLLAGARFRVFAAPSLEAIFRVVPLLGTVPLPRSAIGDAAGDQVRP